MVELMFGTLGVFTKGPIDEVGFVDLTDRVAAAGLNAIVSLIDPVGDVNA